MWKPAAGVEYRPNSDTLGVLLVIALKYSAFSYLYVSTSSKESQSFLKIKSLQFKE